MQANSLIASHHMGSLTAKELTSQIERIWLELQANPAQLASLVAANPELRGVDFAASTPIVARERGQGLTAADVLIDITINLAAAGAFEGLKVLWLRVVAPRIKVKVDDGLGGEADISKNSANK